MLGKELRKLSRKELLEVLVLQSKEIDKLNEELQRRQQETELRNICIQDSGSIAEAALRLNHVFEDADAAAKQYLESIKAVLQMQQEALRRVAEKEHELQQELDRLRQTQQDTPVYGREIDYAG